MRTKLELDYEISTFSDNKQPLLSPGQVTRNIKMVGSLQHLKNVPVVIDDHTINDHIRRIMANRPAISDLAQKYGL